MSLWSRKTNAYCELFPNEREFSVTFPSLRKSVPILLVLFLCLFAQTARSQSTFRPQDDPTSTRENAITKSVQEISPAVVGINVTAVQEQRVGPFANDPFFRQFFENDPFYRQFMQRQKYEYPEFRFRIFDFSGRISSHKRPRCRECDESPCDHDGRYKETCNNNRA